MLVFSTKHFSNFSFRADFARHSFANISFFDAGRRRILFHLSLRSKEGLAVCNHRGPGPDDWARENRRRITLDPDGNRVEIRFSLPRVTVLLNGNKVFSFGSLIGLPRFPDLRQITFVDYQGGIQASTIDMEHKTPAGSVLTLTPRLELRGQLGRPHDPDGLRLEIEGTDPAPALITSATRTGSALWSVLPGRIWQGLAPDAQLPIRLFDGSRMLSELAVHRRDLLHRIQASLETGDIGGDPVLVTQIIEHVRFSGVFRDLEPSYQSRILQLADRLGLDRFLELNEVPAVTPDKPGAPPAPEIALQNALAQIAQALRQGDDPDALTRLLGALPLPPADMLQLFYVALSEPFCQRNAFDLLYDHARQHINTAEIPASDDAWFNSGLLPYLLRDGRIETLIRLLRKLADETERWIMTPPLAWTVRAALDDSTLPAESRNDVITAFLALIETRAGDYWQRNPCTQLIETMITLVGAGPRLGTNIQRTVEETALRIYGLTPDFWHQCQEHERVLPPQLIAARDAFAILYDPRRPRADRAEALALFERAYCSDCPRVRLDLFGPSGLPGTEVPTLPALMHAGLNPGEAALRYMASPDMMPVGQDLADAVRTTLPELPRLVDRSPFYALQCTASRRAMALLTEAAAGTDPQLACADLLPDLDRLSDPATHWVGLGLALGLLNGLLDTTAAGATDTLITWTKQALNRAKTHKTVPASWKRTPALAMPVLELRKRATAGRSNAQAALESLGLSATAAVSDRDEIPGRVNPLFDTVVVVFSCRAHLDTRIPELRAGWISRLETLGVPYVIVTGDGDGTLEGDILRLHAPDDYEGLPQKTLAAIRWVHDHTSFAHMLKIDDDCFLNAEEFFHSLSFRKFDYYGRTLTRVAGQMDRAWHCAKSTTPRGQLEFDKSPEPSSYCDGGSGYALSRHAMAALLDAAGSVTGQALIQASFMEDKLVGDLLALNGISPANEDYHIAVRRRGRPGGIAVSRWVNGFDASQTAPVKLVHLDNSRLQAQANRRLDQPGLFPKKIWPSYQGVALGEHTNALEMVTDISRLSAAREAPVAVVASMRNEMFMLPHFLTHYRRLGVESFLVADNCSTDGTLEYLADQPDVALFSVDTDYNQSHYGVAWQQALMAHFRTGEWSLVADADELLTWELPQTSSLRELVGSPEFETANAARIFMLDMYPQGELAQAGFHSGAPFAEAGFTDRVPFLCHSFARGPYSNAPTWTSAVRHRLIPGSRNELFVAQKIALLRYSPFLRLSAGLHYVAGARLATRELLFGHFKYNANFRRKAQAEVARGQHFNDAEEYRKYLALISEGRERIYDPDLSVPWAESPFVKARLT